jgi:hypothetical protein
LTITGVPRLGHPNRSRAQPGRSATACREAPLIRQKLNHFASGLNQCHAVRRAVLNPCSSKKQRTEADAAFVVDFTGQVN